VSRRVVFIQGGGLGRDLEPAVRRILAAAGVKIEWEVFEAGHAAMEQGREPLPRDMLAAVRETGLALKTKLLQPPAGGAPNFNVQLRRELGLFASVRPLRNLQGLPARFRSVNILLIREITEDLYTAIEHEIVPGVVQSLKVVTEAACRRFFRFTFELARAQGRRRIHCIHKANILKLADGLFLDCFRQAAREFPEIEPREMIVDNCCMQLVTNPGQFDVLATGNLYGDLLSDLGAGLIGGISATVGVNHGDGVRVYESIHGASRETVGADRANPLPLLFPALELLRDLGEEAAASRILAAVEGVLVAGRVRTPDLGGAAGTMEMAEAIVAGLAGA
jgi:isocitrate dehydrogenase (NAD+)